LVKKIILFTIFEAIRTMSDSTEQSKAHWKRYENVTVRCEFCVKTFKTTKAYQDHAELNHMEQVALSSSSTIQKKARPF